MPSDRRRPDPPALPTNERAPVWVGVAVWAVLGVLAAVRHADLVAQGRGWWVWTPPMAVALGLLGIRWLAGKGR